MEDHSSLHPRKPNVWNLGVANSGKGRFIGIPEPKNAIILVVTVTGRGPHPTWNPKIGGLYTCFSFFKGVFSGSMLVLGV